MKQAAARGAKGRADRYFSLIVRSAGCCARCGSTQNLQCAHIVSRRFVATRCDKTNAVALCARCHIHLTHEPFEHVAFATGLLGESGYAALRAKALSGERPDWSAVAAELSAEWSTIQDTR